MGRKRDPLYFVFRESRRNLHTMLYKQYPNEPIVRLLVEIPDKHFEACSEGADFALARSTLFQIWREVPHPSWLGWFAERMTHLHRRGSVRHKTWVEVSAKLMKVAKYDTATMRQAAAVIFCGVVQTAGPRAQIFGPSSFFEFPT